MTNYIIFFFHTLAIGFLSLCFGYFGPAALTSFIALLFVLVNLFVIKQINLLGFHVTCADAYIIGASFGINLLQEIWGKKTARTAIWISFAAALVYVIMGYFHLWYNPASFDTSHEHFAYLFNHTTRIISASFISYLIVQFTDTRLYAFTKKKADGKHFVFRNYLSMMSSQLFDTILFSFLGLYGIVHNIMHIMIVSYAVKVAAIILSTPFMYLAKKIVKK